MTTVFAHPEKVRRDWFVVDASGKTLGRLATQLAFRLRGKHKTTFTPSMDRGDNIIVINCEKVLLKNPLGRAMFKKLHVVTGEKHAHAAQQPKPLDI